MMKKMKKPVARVLAFVLAVLIILTTVAGALFGR